MRKHLYILALLFILGFIYIDWQIIYAQILPTATPAMIRLASVTPLPLLVERTPTQSSLSLSGVTATPEGVTMLQTISDVNVRSSPEIAEDNQIGLLISGSRYVITGRYFNWIEFQYDLSPTNRAWVYADLVEIIGDEALIPIVEVNATPTPDPLVIGPTLTREFILAEPGGVLTVTAQSRIIQLPDGESAVNLGEFSDNSDVIEVLPTYTYPPELAIPTLEVARQINLPTTQSNNNLGTFTGDVPPIFLIILLGFGGILGLIISTLRG